jgi:hypothetical protein
MTGRAMELILIAEQLTEPDEPNGEYIRGQAELICDACGLNMESYRDAIASAIAGNYRPLATQLLADMAPAL